MNRISQNVSTMLFFSHLIDTTNKVTMQTFVDLPYENATNQLIKINSKKPFILIALLEKL